MLVVISPAKRLDWSEHPADLTTPEFMDDALRLVKTARNLTLGNLKSLMDLSDENQARFKDLMAVLERG